MNPIISWPVRQDASQGLYLWPLALMTSLLGTSPAMADWHGELSVLSDYVYRGYTKNRSNPLVQAHIDYEGDSGWYAGVGVSQVSFDDRSNPEYADVEFKPYLGWTLPITNDWRADLAVTGYLYNDKVFAKDADYAEFYGSLHYLDWLSAKISVAPDAYQRHVTTLNYELNCRRDIFDSLQFSAGLGYYQPGELLHQTNDYFYWNAGVSWFATSYLSLDIRYVDVNLNRQNHLDPEQDEFYPRLLENKYLLSITLGF